MRPEQLAELEVAALQQPGAVRRYGGIKFQCPACAAEGHDAHRDNACLFFNGKWGCAWASDTEQAHAHRQAIGEALGVSAAAPPPSDYIEAVSVFLAEDDPPTQWVFPELLPCGVILLLHGEPRARKSLAALELALAAATGTAPFGLARFAPAGPVPVLYVQEEDARALTRPRLRALVTTRCGATRPETLHVAVRRGIDLDDPAWTHRLIADMQARGIAVLVLDAARRLSAKTDEGPGKVRELIGVLRALVTATGATIVIVHHDVKPPQNGQDQRRRSQRASGGDWFAASECPVHVERLGTRESLVFPEDYKHTVDPAPFTFACETSDGLITQLVGSDTTSAEAERAGIRGKVLDWLRVNGPATKTGMQKAGLARWDTLAPVLEALCKEGKRGGSPRSSSRTACRRSRWRRPWRTSRARARPSSSWCSPRSSATTATRCSAGT